MPNFPTCKITVLKKLCYEDLVEEYRRENIPKGPCPLFEVGQEFILDAFLHRPGDFKCNGAWQDIHKYLLTLMLNGDFGVWMKNPDNFITCCTDGITPVIFKIERLAEET